VADITPIETGSDLMQAEAVQSDPDGVTAAVNVSSWKKLPIADRDTKFAFRAATDRLAAHAASIEQFASWFFWRDQAKPANNRNSYRMPFADVFDDGTVKLVPAAVFSAAAQLSGAHGLLDIPADEKEQIKRAIDQIYDLFRNQWNDPRQVPPWTRESNSVADAPVKASVSEENDMPIELVDDDDLTAAVRTSGWSSLPTSTGEWDEGAARAALDAWSDGDMGKYAKGFLWFDAENREKKTAYKFPIAKPVNGKLTIFIRAVNNADSRLSSSSIPAADKAKIQGILDSIQKRYKGSDATTAGAAPLRAPSSWFENPMLPGPTKLRITADGRVSGHLAQWNTCHRGIGSSCVLAPHSITDYAHFKTGTTMTADGMLRPVGNLTYGGGHADINLGYIAAAAHYDEAGTTYANVNVGEDAYGIWVAGSMAPGTGELEAQQLRSHPLSGDWRRTGGNLELIAALAVNTPGFPIEEPQYSVAASGEQTSLIAAGVVFEDSVVVVASGEAEHVAKRIESLEVKAAELQAKVDRNRAARIIDLKL
jgi:hypothetical protein